MPPLEASIFRLGHKLPEIWHDFIGTIWSYPGLILTGGSPAVIAIALVWFTKRAFDVQLFPL